MTITLRELINKVNTRLEENFKKEVINKGYSFNGYSYDEIKGRRYIGDYKLRQLVRDEAEGYQISSIDTVDRNTKLNIYDVVFKLKRKRSGMMGSSYTDMMTYVEIVVDKDISDEILDMKLDELHLRWVEKIKAENEMTAKKNDMKLDNFNLILENKGLTKEDFKELHEAYKKLSYSQKIELGLIV